MHRGVVVAVGALVGCGRIGFDPPGDDGTGSGGPTCTVTPQYITSACVNHDGNPPQPSLSVMLPVTIPAGALIAVSVDYDDLDATVSIGDTLGSVFSPAGPSLKSPQQTAQTFYAIAPTAGDDTIIASWSPSIPVMTLFVHAYSGIDVTAPLRAANGKLGSSRTLATDPIAVAPHDLVVAHGTIVGVSIVDLGADLTARETCNDNMTGDLVAADAGSATPTFVADGSAAWIITATTFRPAPCP